MLPKSKEEVHKRIASFSGSIQSNDSVFTDTEDACDSLQTSGRSLPGGMLALASEGMGVRYSRSRRSRPPGVGKSPSSLPCTPGPRNANLHLVGGEVQSDKRSPKDSGYGSRLDTDEIQSPPLSDKSSPSRVLSPVKQHGSIVGLEQNANVATDALKLPQILPLAHSPVMVNGSYRQFYYLGDPVNSSAALNETPFSQKLLIHRYTPSKSPTPSRGRYPDLPILPPQHSTEENKKIILHALQPIKSASCCSLDRLSLTSSLEEYASNLEKIDVNANASTDEDVGTRRERMVSMTRFETTNLELPQCTTVVKVVVPVSSSSASAQTHEETKRRRSLLDLFQIGKRKTRPAKSSPNTANVMLTSAGWAKLRKRKQKRERRVVSDDLTHQIHIPTAAEIRDKVVISSPVDGHSMGKTKRREERREKHTTTKRHSLEIRQYVSKQTQTSTPSTPSEMKKQLPVFQDFSLPVTGIGPYTSEMSKSTDGLADLQHLSAQLRKLAQPAQSTTNLDLSQRASETMSVVGLRPSHSVDDLVHPVAAQIGHSLPQGAEQPREGFLWRVLGRANQRWPAYIQIISIQNSQTGVGGICVRKGQQVRALYRVSGRVIVETETHHLAAIPYECCRISRKYYGVKSALVQLSYSQLYVPPLELLSLANNHSPVYTAQAPSSNGLQKYINYVPIEMVAIQDNYDCKPLGEINIDAGDKLRVLYCDEELVYAVKENGEAGLLTRNYCRLTRKSEKTYQKWVEATHSPFQADYPVKFNRSPPSFLMHRAPAANESPTQSSSNLVKSNKSTTNAKLNVKLTGGCATLSSSHDTPSAHFHPPAQNALKSPPKPTNRHKESPVSPPAQNGRKSQSKPPPVSTVAASEASATSFIQRIPSQQKRLEPHAKLLTPTQSIVPEPTLTPTLAMRDGQLVSRHHSLLESTTPSLKITPSFKPTPSLKPITPSLNPTVAIRDGRPVSRHHSLPKSTTPSLKSTTSSLKTTPSLKITPSFKPPTPSLKPTTPSLAPTDGRPVSRHHSLPKSTTPSLKSTTSSLKTTPSLKITPSFKPTPSLTPILAMGDGRPVSRYHTLPKTTTPSLNPINPTLTPTLAMSDSRLVSRHHSLNVCDRIPVAPAVRRSKIMSFSGKLMTVVRNYVPQTGSLDYTIRRGLRVKVLHTSEDGQTLRVATKTGAQFDIPVSHLCFSRKNSEPSLNRLSATTLSSIQYQTTANTSTQSGSATYTQTPNATGYHQNEGNPPTPTSPTTQLPLECGKIMTIIHNFAPSADISMVTIRRGLRVKVLGGQDDMVKVITKTGTIFSIPRSHLRLSHKTSDASEFASTPQVKQSTEKVPPPLNPVNTHIPPASNGLHEDDSLELTIENRTINSSPELSHKEVNTSSHVNGMQASPLTKDDNSSVKTDDGASLSVRRGRGYRVSSTGSQVFELC